MATVVYVDKAFAAMSALLDGRRRGMFSDLEFFQNFAEGAPLFSIHIEERVTGGTLNLIKVCKPSRSLLEFLAATTAENRNSDVTPQVSEAEDRAAHETVTS